MNLIGNINNSFSNITDKNSFAKTDLNYLKTEEKELVAGNINDTKRVVENEDLNKTSPKLRIVKKSTKYNPKSGGLYKTEKVDLKSDFMEFLKAEKSKQDSILKDSKVFDNNGVSNKNILDGKFEIDIEKLKEIRALKNIKNNSLDEVENAYKLLLKNGISPEKVDMSVLYQAVILSKEEPTQAEYSQALDDNNFSISNAKIKDTLVKTMLSNNIDVSQENINKLEKVYYKINELTNLEPKDKVNLLKQKNAMTINNLYKSKFLPENMYRNETLTEEMRTQLTGLLRNENIDLAYLPYGQLLLQEDIPVTADNIDKLIFLDDLDNNIDYENVFNQAIKKLQNSELIFDTDLYTKIDVELENSYYNMERQLNDVSDENINSFSQKSQNPYPNTLNSLISHNKVSSNNTDQSNFMKQQINDIRNHMTQQAITRLSINGVKIGHMPIEKALSTLKNADKIDFATNLKLMDVDANRENLVKIKDIYNKIPYTNNLNPKVYGDIIKENTTFNINNINALNIAYDQFATMPTSKYNDSYKNIENQINSNLLTLGIDDTIENIKAYKILSKNQMDIDEANLMEVKVITGKLDNISERLNPSIIAKMIKDKVNPLNIHVDEVINYINDFEEKFGIDRDKTTSEYIYEMDRENKFDEDQREKVMAFYRALNIMRKNDDIALGITLKHNRNLTLNNLFESSKIYERINSNKINDFKIDSDFGYSETIVNDNNIKTILEDRQLKNTFDYNKSNLDRLDNIVGEKNILLDEATLSKPIDDFVNNQNREPYDNTLQPKDFQTAKLNNLDEFTIMWLQNNYMQTSIENMEMVQDIVTNQEIIADSIDRIMELEEFSRMEDVVMDTNLENLKGEIDYSDLLKNMSEQLTFSKDFLTHKAMQDGYQKVKRFLDIQNKINNSDNTDLESYPVRVNGTTQMLNIHVVDENIYDKTTIETYMSLTTDQLGAVEVFIKINNEQAELTIYSQDEKSLSYMENNQDELKQLLLKEGIEVISINFEKKEEKNILKEEIQDIKTKVLEKDLFRNLYNQTI